MFKSKEVGDAGEIIVPAPMDHLDPIREHRFFCPWRSAQAQARADTEVKLPGWRILLKTMSNDAHLRTLYSGQSKSNSQSSHMVPTTPSTPARPSTHGNDSSIIVPSSNSLSGGALGNEEEDEKQREAKDKERWARLRRVKSLFETKGGRKLRHPFSRPGSSHSTKATLAPAPAAKIPTSPSVDEIA